MGGFQRSFVPLSRYLRLELQLFRYLFIVWCTTDILKRLTANGSQFRVCEIELIRFVWCISVYAYIEQSEAYLKFNFAVRKQMLFGRNYIYIITNLYRNYIHSFIKSVSPPIKAKFTYDVVVSTFAAFFTKTL